MPAASPAFLGVISQMTIRASRGMRLLVAAAIAWLGLALCAQAAHATYGKVTIVKINKGGNESDKFTFHPASADAADFSLKGGEQDVQGRVQRGLAVRVVRHWNNPKLTVTEKPTSGYELKGIKCVHKQGSGDWPNEPSRTRPGRRRHDRVGLNHQPQGELLGMGEVLRHEHPQAA